MTQAVDYNNDKTLLLFKHGRGLASCLQRKYQSYRHNIYAHNPHHVLMFVCFFLSKVLQEGEKSGPALGNSMNPI